MPLKSKLEIIEEIAAYYSEDTSRRGYDANRGVCLYYMNENKMCAVGYCLKNPEKFKAFEGTIDGFLQEGKIKHKDFKPEYQLQGNIESKARFWKDLQDFHDITGNWNREGLTDQGQDMLKRLRKTYAVIKYSFLLKQQLERVLYGKS
jgi:hypothetical protein